MLFVSSGIFGNPTTTRACHGCTFCSFLGRPFPPLLFDVLLPIGPLHVGRTTVCQRVLKPGPWINSGNRSIEPGPSSTERKILLHTALLLQDVWRLLSTFSMSKASWRRRNASGSLVFASGALTYISLVALSVNPQTYHSPRNAINACG